MKNTIFAILFLTATIAVARFRGAPIQPEVDSVLNSHDNSIIALQALPANASQTAAGIIDIRAVRGSYSCAVSSNCTAGSHSTDLSLPAKAVVTRAFMVSTTTWAGNGAPSLALECGGTKNLMASRLISGEVSGAVRSGKASGDLSVALSEMSSACYVNAVVTSSDISAGAANIYIEYFTNQ